MPATIQAPASTDVAIVRRLAGRVREIAESPENQNKVKLGKLSNSLKLDRPLVFTHPENAWTEIFPESSLECKDPVMRSWELQLRKRVFWFENIKCDRPAYPFLEVPWKVKIGDFGVKVAKHALNEAAGASYSWSGFPVEDIARDLPKLRFRQPTVDREGTLREVNLAKELIGDLLPPRLYTETYWWTVGMTINVIDLVGMENLMVLFYDDPEGVHQLMSFMRDENMHFIEWFEREGLLNDNCDADNVGSGGPGVTDELPKRKRAPGEPVRLEDMWGFGESQETVGVSPDMFAEFIFPYQVPLLEKFGMNYYGCCEPLDVRIQHVLKVPRLRRVSVSPWAKLDKMAEYLGRNYVYCRKLDPSRIAGPTFDEESVRQDLRRTLEAAGKLNLELIMKDTHTIGNDRNRIGRWVEIAREEVDRYFG